MSNQRLSFAQFGEGFMLHAFTPRVIGTSVDAALREMGTKQVHMKEGPAEVRARISSRGCRVKRVSSVELAIFIPLHMDMDVLILGLVPEKYAVDVVVEVRLVTEARRPLTVFLAMKPIPLAAVSVKVQGSSWTKIAESIGELADKIRTAVAKEVWGAFNTHAAIKSRTVDVLASIKDAHKAILSGGREDITPADAEEDELPEAWAGFVEPNAYALETAV